MKNIILVHLHDDYSGSPSVASKFIRSVDNCNVELLIGSSSSGFLSDTGFKVNHFFYKLGIGNIQKLIYFFLSQLSLLGNLSFMLFNKRKERDDTVVVINTLLPFSAAIVSKVFGVKCVYYCHEVGNSSRTLFNLLKFFCDKLSDGRIHVSEYVKNSLNFSSDDFSQVIYNTYDDRFSFSNFNINHLEKWNNKNVMMACSLKHYKGVDVFLSLSRLNEDLNFYLLLNAEQEDVKSFIDTSDIPVNCNVICKPSDISYYYDHCFVNLNLSNPDYWVETFGLTIIEAMTKSTPSIAPNYGGPIEVLGSNLRELLLDPRNLTEVDELVKRMANDYDFWFDLSIKSKHRCSYFSPEKYKSSVNNYISLISSK